MTCEKFLARIIPALLLAVWVPAQAAYAQDTPRFEVRGLYFDPENEVVIDLYMEPLFKFLAIAAVDPEMATDPERIVAAVAEVDVPNNQRTFKLLDDLIRPAGAGDFGVFVDEAILDLGEMGALDVDTAYIVLAVYTDLVPRSPDGVSEPEIQFYGTNSPGVFTFDTSVAPETPTPTVTETPTPTIGSTPTPTSTPTPLPFGLVLEAEVDPVTNQSIDSVLIDRHQVDLRWVTALTRPGTTLELFFDRDDRLDVSDSDGDYLATVIAGASKILPLGVGIDNNGDMGLDFGVIDLTSDGRFSPPPDTGSISVGDYPIETFRWDFSDFPAGLYYVYGVMRDPDQGVVVDYATYRVLVTPASKWPILVGGASDDRFVHGVALDDVVASATELDVVAVTQSGLFRVYDYSGNSWDPFEINLGVTIDTAPVTADVDGDGVVEVVVGTNAVASDNNPVFAERNALLVIDAGFKEKYSALRALEVTPDDQTLENLGLLNAIYWLPEDQAAFSTPAIRDVDDDGRLEVVLVTRPVNGAPDSLVQTVSFSSAPDQAPVLETSIAPRRSVKNGLVMITELKVGETEEAMAKGSKQVGTLAMKNAVEFTNVSGRTLDISNWQMTFYDIGSWPAPAFTANVTEGTLLPPSGVFTVEDQCGENPVVIPPSVCFEEKMFDWELGSTQMAVLLRTNTGVIVDFMTTGEAAAITEPIDIPTRQWIGSGIIGSQTPELTLQRVGSTDTNSKDDWVRDEISSLGAINADLNTSFTQSGGNLGAPSVGNVDDDETLEVVFGSKAGDVFAVEPYSHAIGARPVLNPVLQILDPALQSPSLLRPPALADVDDDGQEEIVVAISERDGGITERTQLHLVNGDGTPVLADTLIYEPAKEIASLSAPAVARLWEAPDAPFVALLTTREGFVGINLADGSVLFQQIFDELDQAFSSSSPTVGQAQPQTGGSSEAFEFFVGGGGQTQGNLFGAYYDTSTNSLMEVDGVADHQEPVLDGFNKAASILGTVEIADLNGDRKTDLVYTNEQGFLHRVELPGMARADQHVLVPSDFPWPAYKHDRRRTGSALANGAPVAPYRPGDVNRDGVIDENDLFLVSKLWSEGKSKNQFGAPGTAGIKEADDERGGAPQGFLLRVLSGMRN